MSTGKSERVADSCGDVLGVVALSGSSNEIGKVRDTYDAISLLENQSTMATSPSQLFMVSLTVHLSRRSCLEGAVKKHVQIGLSALEETLKSGYEDFKIIQNRSRFQKHQEDEGF
ncbi:hypothetical protein AALP_AA1G190500 [Arabis alpina]|uniref:Uncharacterized protein n=1 Tax=Arabis alpina TaxID=50452 RepID=A0A087HP60_ARAAL|nr:hypothetical protein AALP_AA1G190500 [Arabis alpina]